MELDPKIKQFCDKKLQDLFSEKYWQKQIEKKEKIGNTDHLYTKEDARMAFVCHSVTIRKGQLIDELYTRAVKVCCPHLEVIKIGKLVINFSYFSKNFLCKRRYKFNVWFINRMPGIFFWFIFYKFIK
jgi:myosin-crossreactive antigen